jgi:hypothetical protein
VFPGLGFFLFKQYSGSNNKKGWEKLFGCVIFFSGAASLTKLKIFEQVQKKNLEPIDKNRVV